MLGQHLQPVTTVCSNDTTWDLRPPALTGPSAAVQPTLAFLRSHLTSSEVPRPTKTLMLHRQPAVTHSDLELSYFTYRGPQSSFFPLHLSSCLSCSSFNYGLQQDTELNSSWSPPLAHLPTWILFSPSWFGVSPIVTSGYIPPFHLSPRISHPG